MRALALFSGGLDSLLAIKIIKDLGIEVIALHFNIGFGGKGDFSQREKELKARLAQVGVELCAIDIREQFFSNVLFTPKHGYGKYFNPCIDCHANMFAHALALLLCFKASFVISGEVLGQRPKSQRAEALNQVLSLASSRAFSLAPFYANAQISSENVDSIESTKSVESSTEKIEKYYKNLGAENGDLSGLILRPMSAKLLEPSIPELRGWVERERLLDISGRDRSRQLEMVARFGISDYERPGGGCLLTDTTLSNRIKDFSSHRAKNQNAIDSIESKSADSIKFSPIESKFNIESKSRQNAAPKNFNFLDISVLKYGRYLVLENGARFIISRNEIENEMLCKIFAPKDIMPQGANSAFIALEILDEKGPLGFLEKSACFTDLKMAAQFLLAYGKTQREKRYKIRLCEPRFLGEFFGKNEAQSEVQFDLDSIKSEKQKDLIKSILMNLDFNEKDSIKEPKFIEISTISLSSKESAAKFFLSF